jgi:integrase-like protein
MPVGPLFCVINGCTRGRAWAPSAARAAPRRRAVRAGVRRRFVPRHAHAIELAREGVPLNVIQRQLGYRDLGVTAIYVQGIDPGEIIETIHAHRQPETQPARSDSTVEPRPTMTLRRRFGERLLAWFIGSDLGGWIARRRGAGVRRGVC